MKNLLSLIAVLILSSPLFCQTTNVTATITDPDGQTWNNGTFIATFVPSQTAQQGPTCNGNPNFTQQFRGNLTSGGVMTVSVCDNGFVKPPGSTWQFTLCSNTSAPCQNTSQFVTGASQNLSTQLSQQLIAPRFNNGQFAFGYSDVEVVTPVQPGGEYWNVTNTVGRIWNGSSWQNLAGGGTNNPGGTIGQIQTNGGGVFGAFTASGDATINTTTGVVTVTPKWSSLVPPTGNLSLNLYQTLTSPFTTLINAGDFGASPTATSITNYTDSSVSTTDNSFDLGVNVPATSYHNAFYASIGANQIFGVCSTGGGVSPVGFVMVGQFTPTVTCGTVAPLSPLSRLWAIVGTGGHTAFTAYDGVGGYTGNLVQFNTHTAAGTTFNFLTTCAGIVNTTPTTCPLVLDTIRGDGALFVPSFSLNGSTLLTSVQGNGAKLQAATGTATAGNCAQFDTNLNLVSAANPCGTGGGGGGFPTGVGIAGSIVSGTPVISQTFLPTVDVRLFFSTPYPTYAQAQSQDFGAVLNAAFLAATASGACVDTQGLNELNAPNVTVLYATTNWYAGLTSNTFTPCVIGANFTVVTGATIASPAGALVARGGVPGGIGQTGFVIQLCNTTPTCSNGTGGISVPQFQAPSGTGSCSDVGGTNCYPTGLPSSPALTHYQTGTVQCTGLTCTGTGTSWTTGHLGNIEVGATIISSCPANTCTIGSTSGYVSGRVAAINTGAQTLTLAATWTGVTVSGENYVIWNPNTPVAWCDGCLANSLQKSFTGHEITNLTIDLNGTAGAGFYTKSSQEGSLLNNYTCFLQVVSFSATAGGTCLAWDQTIREASGSGETFMGHWSVYGGRIGMGTNAGGANAFGCIVEGFGQMDGTVALSQANGGSIFELQAIIGGAGSAKFQDACQIDGLSGMFIAGTHTESAINDHWNIGPRNPTYNINLNGLTSSGTLGNAVVEFNVGSSGSQIHGVSRPSGGILAIDDNLPAPTIATSISGTPSSWTLPEYVQSGNNGTSIFASGNTNVTGTSSANNFQWVGPPYIFGPCPGSVMSPTISGNSAIGVSSDCNWYESLNGGAITQIATLAVANTWTATQTFGTIQVNTQINSGSSGTLAPIVMGNATSGLLTLQPGTGAITSYTVNFPVAQPTSGNTFLSCTAANPAICSWTASSATVAESSITGPTVTNTITEAAAGNWIARNGVETANLTAPWSFANANSTNNNTSLGLLAGVSGSSTGGVAALLYDVNGTGDIFRAYTGGSVASNAYTIGTLQASITTGGVINATTGYKINAGSSAAGHYLRGNGTNYIDGTIAAGDLPTNIPIGNVGSSGLSGTSPISIGSTGAISCSTCVTSAASLTSNQVLFGAGSQASATGDFWYPEFIPSANCNNTTAGSGWSIGSGGTVACRSGTNNLGGYITITDTSSTFAQFMTVIPFDWDTGTRPYIRVYFSSVTDTTNGHTVIPQVKVSCSQAINGTTTDDATFTAAQSLSTTTFGASAVANGMYAGSNVQFGATQMSGCVAGGLFIVQIGRATDTATGNINFYGATINWPRSTPATAQAD